MATTFCWQTVVHLHCILQTYSCVRVTFGLHCSLFHFWLSGVMNGSANSCWPGMRKRISSVLDIKACTAADTHIETLSGIHCTPALNLTPKFLSCILWKVWLWAALTVCRKPTCRTGRTILQGEAKRRGCGGSIQWLSFALTSWLSSTVVLLFF